VLLFYLSGPMIFGVSKAIAREHAAIKNTDALVLDLSDVPLLGVTASLEIENAIKEACDKGVDVFIVGAAGKIQQRLERLGVLAKIPSDRLLMDRTEALRQAVALVADRQERAATLSL
jgi:SulP family sulfate permease